MHKHDRLFWQMPVPGPGPGGPPFGFMIQGGPGGPRFGRGRRMRRGNVRAAILLLLEEEPRNGYQVMQEIEQRSEGAWRPSPGSVYPAFQLLADEGPDPRRGTRRRQRLRAHRRGSQARRGAPRAARPPWQQAGESVPEGVRELMQLAMQVGIATRQVTHAGTEAQRAEAAKILAETRRSLYRILAEDEPADE